MLSHSNAHFHTEDLGAAIEFLQSTVLGTLVLHDEEHGFRSLQSPWTAAPPVDGALTLISHVPRRSALLDQLSKGTPAFVIFCGEHGYISPSWFAPDGRQSAPTWNYETFEAAGQVDLMCDEALRDHLRVLVQRSEEQIGGDWAPWEMGARYETLFQRISGITLGVDMWTYRRKLGQDERAQDFDGALAALNRTGNHSLAVRMRAERTIDSTYRYDTLPADNN